MANGDRIKFEDYAKWLTDEHGVSIDTQLCTYYEAVSKKLLANFEDSKLWQSLDEQMEEMEREYFLRTKYHLFISEEKPKLLIKPLTSVIEKSYRKNIIENINWPKEPIGGWVLPDNWYANLNDLVRSYVVVKYLDGVEFFTTHLQALCEAHGLSFRADYEAKEEGYYAAHTYITSSCSIPKRDWDAVKIDTTIELQVTTQLQEVMRRLTHGYYETRRKKFTGDGPKWQWEYDSDEFAANYLGHILHYIEGMIMDVRSRQEGNL